MAVLDLKDESGWKIIDKDIETFTTRDSGPGGQHRNTTDSCVVMRHIPTGITAKAADRCQHANKRTARALLESRVSEYYSSMEREKLTKERKSQIGSGMRGDKIRTYREKDNCVTDHATGKKADLRKIIKGNIDLLHY